MNFLYEDDLDFVPFSKFDESGVLTELNKTISMAKNRLENLKNNKDEPSFENTCVELDSLDGELSFLTGIFYSLNGANTNENMQQIAREFLQNYLSLEMIYLLIPFYLRKSKAYMIKKIL